MIEKTEDVRDIPILQRLLGGNAVGVSLLVLKQEPEGVAVTSDGAGAQLALRDQVIQEEVLHQTRQRIGLSLRHG
jgi:hypothetical protein